MAGFRGQRAGAALAFENARVNPPSTEAGPHVLALTVHLPLVPLGQGRASPATTRQAGDLSDFLGEAVASRPFLEIDVLLDDHSTVTAVAKVDWYERIVGGTPGRFDLGLRLVRLEGGLDHVPRAREREVVATRARDLQSALAQILDTRDAYLNALRVNPTTEELLPEEALYLSAIRTARSVLGGVA